MNGNGSGMKGKRKERRNDRMSDQGYGIHKREGR